MKSPIAWSNLCLLLYLPDSITAGQLLRMWGCVCLDLCHRGKPLEFFLPHLWRLAVVLSAKFRTNFSVSSRKPCTVITQSSGELFPQDLHGHPFGLESLGFTCHLAWWLWKICCLSRSQVMWHEELHHVCCLHAYRPVREWMARPFPSLYLSLSQ